MSEHPPPTPTLGGETHFLSPYFSRAAMGTWNTDPGPLSSSRFRRMQTSFSVSGVMANLWISGSDSSEMRYWSSKLASTDVPLSSLNT